MTQRLHPAKVGLTASESTPHWPAPPRAPEGAPNVLYIVFDDMGFADLGCYGSEIATPNIDALARGGLRYTNFHTTALCSPTRAALLTGRNHHSVGMGGLADWDFGFPGMRGRIARSAGTLAEMLRLQGYNTFATGKWHLTPMHEISAAGPYDQWPLQRGFDRFYGFMAGATNQWHPDLTEDNHHIEAPDRPGYHLSEDIVDKSIDFVGRQQAVSPGKPWFLYQCFGAQHSPHHAPAEFIEKYVPVFEKGWDVTREERLARQKALGLVPPETQLPERSPGVKPWDSLSDDQRRLAVRLQAAFAGMLEHVDQQVGRMLEYLRRSGQLENTLIVLISDNGASQEGSPLGTVNTERYFNGIRDTLEENLPHLAQIGQGHLSNNYPLGWAMAGNTPLKRYKQTTHGGGVRDPLIIHWPSRIREAGGIRHQFHHVCDITPTVMEVVGITLPESIAGVAQQPIEGTSLAYTFAAPGEPTRKRVQYFEMFGHRGIWFEGWKAVSWHKPGTRFEEDRWELYHLDTDFNETRDLAAEQPGKLAEMIQRWFVEAGACQVLPLNDTMERFVSRNPNSASKRLRWEFDPAFDRVDSSPDVRNRSYRISARVRIPAGGGSGVILSQGVSTGGQVLYLTEGRLAFDYNFVGRHHRVVAEHPVPEGEHELEVRMTRTGDHQAQATLHVDGQACGSVAIPQTYRTSRRGTVRLGWAAKPAVGDFVAPFRFNGELLKVFFEAQPDQAKVDAQGDRREALGNA